MKYLPKHRGIALTAVVLLVATGAVIGSYTVLVHGKPNPATASRQAVLRYVLLGDVPAQDEAYRVAMIDRLMFELADQPSLPALAENDIPATLRGNLVRNLTELKQTWFYSRCERYHSLPPSEQPAYLDQQIAAVLQWSRFDLGINGPREEASPEERRAAYAREFFGEIQQWIADSPQASKPRLTTAVRQALIRWLATRSLSEEPMGTRQALAQRIVVELDHGLKLNQVMGSLNKAEQVQLKANSLFLIEAWLHELAVEYEQLSAGDRSIYLKGRLEQVEEWDLASLLTGPANSSSSGSTTLGSLHSAMQLLGILNGWVERADEASRPRFQAFMLDLQRQWFARQMQ